MLLLIIKDIIIHSDELSWGRILGLYWVLLLIPFLAFRVWLEVPTLYRIPSGPATDWKLCCLLTLAVVCVQTGNS